MSHAVLDTRRRLVFAHRGGAALRPENTVEAFDHGLSLGADGLEFDVHLSRDEQAVVIHDATLDRTTEAQGPVARHTARELAAVDAGYHFEHGGRHPFRGRGIAIPTLREVLARYRDIPIIIELKGSDPDLARVAVREVRAAGALQRVCFGSFEDVTIEAARHCGSDVVTSGARDEIRRAMRTAFLGFAPRRPRFRALQVPERFGVRRIATRRFIRAMGRGGIPVHIWTVNEEGDMVRLLSWGAHAIITDRPDVGVPTVRAFNASLPARSRAGLASR